MSRGITKSIKKEVKPKCRAKIIYWMRNTEVWCDGRCALAKGKSNQPREGTGEGGDVWGLENWKHFPNKWCVRECNRCHMLDYKKSTPLNEKQIEEYTDNPSFRAELKRKLQEERMKKRQKIRKDPFFIYGRVHPTEYNWRKDFADLARRVNKGHLPNTYVELDVGKVLGLVSYIDELEEKLKEEKE